jgi:2-polyprenyl-3-methyl-5-hydroxy-6-metoxy-1,4-benzoquinol methylase
MKTLYLNREDLLTDLIEYTGLSRKTIINRCNKGSELIRDEWNKVQPKTAEEITKFYRNTPNYIYDLTPFHYIIFAAKMNMNDRLEGKVLDYGAGIGTSLLLAWNRGLRDLTYVDLKGKTWDYAKWRFNKWGAEVKMLDAEYDIDKLETYDSIICEEVLEHVPDWKELAFRLIKMMNEGGFFFIKTRFSDHNPALRNSHPMHLSSGNTDVIEFFREHGKKGKYHIEW